MLGAGLFLALVGLLLVVIQPGFQVTYVAFLFLLGGVILMALSALIGIAAKHKLLTVVVVFVVALLIVLAFRIPIAPQPAPGTPAEIKFFAPQAKTSNMNVSGTSSWVVKITGTGTVVFDMVVKNQGATSTQPILHWKFANAREANTWESGQGSPANMSDISDIKVSYVYFGIVGGEVNTFQLGAGQSQEFQFEIHTTYPTGWATLPASLLGYFSVAGNPSDVLELDAPPTPPMVP